MIKAVRPVVVILLAQAAFNIIYMSFTGLITIIIGALVVFALVVLKTHLVISIVTAIAF